MGNYKKQGIKSPCDNKMAIEYSSDVLIGLQLKGAGTKEFDVTEAKAKNPREIELVILKNRNGVTGKRIQYKYYPMFNYFEEIREDEKPAPIPIKKGLVKIG
ncbi:MAG: hypothetical protein K2K06_10940 [Oscillospiraceae bacterium]|nr:hypothetical protein [Oscillospiraceae bacterium]